MVDKEGQRLMLATAWELEGSGEALQISVLSPWISVLSIVNFTIPGTQASGGPRPCLPASLR